MKQAAALAVVMFAFALPARAQAHYLPHHKHLTLAQKVAFFRRSVRHDRTALVWVKRTLHYDRSLAAELGSVLRFHERALRIHLRCLREYGARLRASQRPAHYLGWMCIHGREGAWNDEGAPYYGGLQMTLNWMGVVGDAALLSPLQQMWAAERVSAAHGFSWAWMQGQWPLTFPPCASFF